MKAVETVDEAVEFLTAHPSAQVLTAGALVRDELDRLRAIEGQFGRLREDAARLRHAREL